MINSSIFSPVVPEIMSPSLAILPGILFCSGICLMVQGASSGIAKVNPKQRALHMSKNDFRSSKPNAETQAFEVQRSALNHRAFTAL